MYKNIGKKAGEGLLNVFTKGAYGRSKKIGKLIVEKAVNSNNANNSNNAKAVPVYKPNKKSSEQEYNMRSTERRRIKGGNNGVNSDARIKSKELLTNGINRTVRNMQDVISERRKTLKDRATKAGEGADWARAFGEAALWNKKYNRDYTTKKMNERNAELRRIKGGSQGTSFDSSKKAQYDAEQRRIKGGSQGTSFDQQKAAENRRIAGGRTAGTGTRVDRTKDAAKDIVKKGKKKVKSLMKRFFN